MALVNLFDVSLNKIVDFFYFNDYNISIDLIN